MAGLLCPSRAVRNGIISHPAGSPAFSFHLIFSSRSRHTRCLSDWRSDVCSSDLIGRAHVLTQGRRRHTRCLSDWSSDVCSSDDRKSTRLNSSHLGISYAVFCLKKKTKQEFSRYQTYFVRS